MAVTLRPPVFQFVDSAGKPYAGGSLTFTESGTSTPLSTYSDATLSTANANPVVLNSAGFPDTNIFLQNRLYRVVLKDASGNTIFSRDNVAATDFTPASADVGAAVLVKVGSGNPNGNVSGTAGSSGVLPTLYWDYTNSTLWACTTTGTTSTAVWTAEIGPSGNQLVWTIKDIVTDTPAQDDEGTSYIVGSSFGSFVTGQIITDNGEGEFTVTQPVSDGGWIAYVQDEDKYYSYQGTAWVEDGLTPTVVDFKDFTENNAPGDPAANDARLYAADESGVTNLLFRDSDGVASGLRSATQAEMEAATSNVRTVTPGRQHFHPAMPKAIAFAAANGGTRSGATNYNITSIARDSEGNYTVTLANEMATGYGVLLTIDDTTSALSISANIINSTTFSVRTQGDTDVDFTAVVYGELA